MFGGMTPRCCFLGWGGGRNPLGDLGPPFWQLQNVSDAWCPRSPVLPLCFFIENPDKAKLYGTCAFMYSV